MTIRAIAPCSRPRDSAAGSPRNSRATRRCAKLRTDRASSSARRAPNPSPARAGQGQILRRWRGCGRTRGARSPRSGAVEDRRQAAAMGALAIEGAADRSKGLGEREDVGSDEEVRVLGTYRMPKDALGGDRDFGDEVGPRQSDARFGEAAQRDAADDPVVGADLAVVEEAAELLGLVVAGNRRGQPDAKSFRPGLLDALP